MNTNITRKKAIFIYILVSLFLCFEMGVQVSPGVMTDQLMHDLNIDAFGLGLMSGFYFYTYTVMQIPAGLLFDRFNVRYVVVAPLLICSLGAFLFGFATNIYFGALARLLMGAGSAFAFISVLVVASDIFKKKYFALLAGLTQMLAAFGAMGGEWPFSKLVDLIGWRHTISSVAAFGFLLAIFIWIFVRYEKCYQYKRTEQQTQIFKSIKVLFTEKQTWFIAAYACLLWAPMAAFASLWGVPYLHHAYALSESDAASMMLLMWLGIAFASPLLGWWSDFIKSRTIPLTLSAIVGLVSFVLLMWGKSLSLTAVGILIFLVGASCAGQALSFAVVRDIREEGQLAAAIGFNNMAVVIAGAIFQPLVGFLIGHHSTHLIIQGVPVLTATDYRFGLGVLVITYCVAVVVSGWLIRESLQRGIKSLFSFIKI